MSPKDEHTRWHHSGIEVVLGLVLLVVAGHVLEDLGPDPLGGEVERAQAGGGAVHGQGGGAGRGTKLVFKRSLEIREQMW